MCTYIININGRGKRDVIKYVTPYDEKHINNGVETFVKKTNPVTKAKSKSQYLGDLKQCQSEGYGQLIDTVGTYEGIFKNGQTICPYQSNGKNCSYLDKTMKV
jgi:hypothetical protein